MVSGVSPLTAVFCLASFPSKRSGQVPSFGNGDRGETRAAVGLLKGTQLLTSPRTVREGWDRGDTEGGTMNCPSETGTMSSMLKHLITREWLIYYR